MLRSSCEKLGRLSWRTLTRRRRYTCPVVFALNPTVVAIVVCRRRADGRGYRFALFLQSDVMIPAVPSGLYFAEGLVMTSIFSTESASICSSAIARLRHSSGDGCRDQNEDVVVPRRLTLLRCRLARTGHSAKPARGTRRALDVLADVVDLRSIEFEKASRRVFTSNFSSSPCRHRITKAGRDRRTVRRIDRDERGLGAVGASTPVTARYRRRARSRARSRPWHRSRGAHGLARFVLPTRTSHTRPLARRLIDECPLRHRSRSCRIYFARGPKRGRTRKTSAASAQRAQRAGFRGMLGSITPRR